jgi:hypothetical protein
MSRKEVVEDGGRKPDRHLYAFIADDMAHMTVPERMSQLVILDDLLKQAEAEKKYLVGLLLGDFRDAGWKTVEWEGKKLIRYSGSRASISKERLLEQGVGADQIVAATTVTEYETISVRGK